MMIITFVIWSTFMAAGGVYIYFVQQIRSYQEQTSQNQTVITQTQDARETISNINKTSSSIIKIKDLTFDPQALLNEINAVRGTGIFITSYKMELDKFEVELGGVASNRSDLINFKQALSELKMVKDAAIPISNFQIEEDLDFNILITLARKKGGKVKQ